MAENTTAKGESVASSGQETKEGQENKPTPRIIVQSSACYTLLFRGRHGELLEKVSEAAQRGFDILEEGGTAVDAVENAVRFLEDINYFNAGRGSLLNNDGEVECDAMIMDGHTLNTGAVMAASNFLHPVSISRKIMEESHHCALSGAGAVEFARRIDFPTCEPEDLVDEETSLKKIYTYEDYPKLVGCLFEGKLVTDTHDTVAAVALDGNGHFACATSSGGIPGKWKGRIGDAPLVGCGGYANKHGAATASGHGEAIMKMTLAREIVYKMEGGENAEMERCMGTV